MLPTLASIQFPREAESSPVKLEGNAIHVWRGDEDVAPQRLEDLHRTLSRDEVDRVAKFRFDRDRRQFVLCRGILRELSGRYLKQRPDDIRFSYGPFGKPMLAGNPIHFNASHTQGMWLIAFSASQAIGIDIEKVRPQATLLEIANRFFQPEESNAIACAAHADQAKMFFTYWVCKEARLKARGLGIGEMTAAQDSELASNRAPEWLRADVGRDFYRCNIGLDRSARVAIARGTDLIIVRAIEAGETRRIWSEGRCFLMVIKDNRGGWVMDNGQWIMVNGGPLRIELLGISG